MAFPFKGVWRAIVVAAVGSTPVPLNTELSPDTAVATAGNYTLSHATFLNPGVRFNSLGPAITLAVPNALALPLSPGTYRVTVTIDNLSAQSASVTVRIGCGTTGTGGVTGTIPGGTFAGSGSTYTVDIVVGATTVGGGIKISGVASSTQFDITFIGYQRIA